MENPKNLKTQKKRASDVIDTFDDILPYTNDQGVFSPPEKATQTRGAESPLFLEYASGDSGTTKSSALLVSDTYPSSSKNSLETPQVDGNEASPMSQDNDMSFSSEVYEASDEMNAEEYKMNYDRRGKAVIFNHDTFMMKVPRPGSDVDVHDLKEAYVARDFEVVVHQNFKLSEVREAITELVKENHSDADCLLVTVLTHGYKHGILCAYDAMYSAEELWSPFTADKCPSLAGKPKIFIIQACLGMEYDTGVTLNWTDTDSVQEYKIPNQADFLIADSTVAGYSSWRNPEKGTWYIQSLCKELQEHASTKDFLKILTRTSRRVAICYESCTPNFPDSHQKKQVPSFKSMLIRDLYFRSKNSKVN